MQPGETITPSDAPAPDEQSVQIPHQETAAPSPQAAVAPPAEVSLPAPVASQPEPVVAPTVPVVALPMPQPFVAPVTPQQEYASNPQVNSDDQVAANISWSASEYIDHPKGSSWFVMFGLGLAALVIVIYFLTRDFVTPVLIGVAGLSFGAFASRQPQALKYELSQDGIAIGQKFYPYMEFKSFSVMDEGAFQSVLLTPLKRFMPPITVYYDPKDEDMILDTLADYLPHEDKDHDLTDQLMKRLRF